MKKNDKINNNVMELISKQDLIGDYSILIANELSSDMINEEVSFIDELEEYEND